MLRRNKNNESRLFTSHLGGLGTKKFESDSAYKSAMFKVLGDLSEEKEKGNKYLYNKNKDKDNKDNDKNKKEDDKDFIEEDKKCIQM